ncbi:hypothetical protein AB0A05_35555 [Streptomyces sp. NPDC046374]|uniref:hypothetical protein n=1 Tax=Streptomyces sp. NPDC046374 TaxID=3154917 RepID=UPI0033C9F958
MTAVRRFSKDNGAGPPAPESPGGLLALRRQLQGPPDFWDRPDGDFGPLDRLSPLTVEARQRANSLYRLGSKALLRGELAPAVDWLGAAAAAGHPGALFRLAVITLRAGEEWEDDVRFLLFEAAQLGHGDARRILQVPDNGIPLGAQPRHEDETYFDEVRAYLSRSAGPAAPTGDSPAAPQDTGEHPDAQVQEQAGGGTGVSDLVLVTAPVLPTIPTPPPRTKGDPSTRKPHLHSVPAGLTLPLPDLQPEPSHGHGLILPSGSSWWSPSALRPARLTQLGRPSSTPAAVPETWQITQRARDLSWNLEELFATRCSQCDRVIEMTGFTFWNVGRPRRYCSNACRQKAYRARQRSDRTPEEPPSGP